MVRMPETRIGMLAAALGVLVVVGVVLPLAFIGGLTLAFSSGGGFGTDAGGTVTVYGPVNAGTVYRDVEAAAGGAERTGSGAQYRCRLVAVRTDARHPRAYRCVVPGHGAGDLGYRVTVRAASACWRAVGDAPPLRGCIRTTTPAGEAWD